jgi:hypothetical protein
MVRFPSAVALGARRCSTRRAFVTAVHSVAGFSTRRAYATIPGVAFIAGFSTRRALAAVPRVDTNQAELQCTPFRGLYF